MCLLCSGRAGVSTTSLTASTIVFITPAGTASSRDKAFAPTNTSAAVLLGTAQKEPCHASDRAHSRSFRHILSSYPIKKRCGHVLRTCAADMCRIAWTTAQTSQAKRTFLMCTKLYITYIHQCRTIVLYRQRKTERIIMAYLGHKLLYVGERRDVDVWHRNRNIVDKVTETWAVNNVVGEELRIYP